MAGRAVTIRNARPEEVRRLAEIEAACWPPGVAADAECFAARLRAWPEGQWAAEMDGRVVGVATSQRIRPGFLLAEPVTYERVTDGNRFARSHCPDGEVFQLVGVSVSPEARGARLGRVLVDHELAFARALPGVRRIVGFTRPVGYCRRPDLPVEEYAALRREDGRWADPVLDFHLGAGARIVSFHPNFRPEDPEALGYGILIEYPMGGEGGDRSPPFG